MALDNNTGRNASKVSIHVQAGIGHIQLLLTNLVHNNDVFKEQASMGNLVQRMSFGQMATTDSYFDRIPAEWKAKLALSMIRPEKLEKKQEIITLKRDKLWIAMFSDPVGKGLMGCFNITIQKSHDFTKDPLHVETSTEKNHSKMIAATSTPIAEYIKDTLIKDNSVLYVCAKKDTDKYDKHFILAVLPLTFSLIQVVSGKDVEVIVYNYEYDRKLIEVVCEIRMNSNYPIKGSWTITQSIASKQHARDNMSAFLGYTHPRMGQDSSANVLEDEDLVRYEIYGKMIEKDRVSTEKEVMALLNSMCPPQQSPMVTRCMQCNGYILHGTG